MPRLESLWTVFKYFDFIFYNIFKKSYSNIATVGHGMKYEIIQDFLKGCSFNNSFFDSKTYNLFLFIKSDWEICQLDSAYEK